MTQNASKANIPFFPTIKHIICFSKRNKTEYEKRATYEEMQFTNQ